jgi:hypothetical protein
VCSKRTKVKQYEFSNSTTARLARQFNFDESTKANLKVDFNYRDPKEGSVNNFEKKLYLRQLIKRKTPDL